VQCQPLSDYGGNPLEPIDIETKVSLVYDEFVSRAPVGFDPVHFTQSSEQAYD
jgi:hypothetical protein